MAVRTVTVDLRLDAGSYLAIARSVVRANQGIDRSLNDIGASAAAAGSAMNYMGRDMAAMGRRARLAERRIKELREEIDRLIAAQAAYAAGAPLPPGFGNGVGNGAGRGGGMMGMLNAVPTPVLAAAGIGLAAAGPAIGALIGGTLLTVLGGGALAAAVIAATKNEGVRHAFSGFGTFLGDEFESYGNAFEGPLIRAQEDWQDRFATMSPKIRRTLAEMAEGIQPLASGFADFIERAGPGLASGMRASLPVLKAIAGELGNMGQAVGDFFEDVGNGSEGAADAMVALMRIIEATTVALGGQILYLETLFGAMGDLPVGVQALLGGSLFTGLLGGGETSSLAPISTGLQEVGERASTAREELEELHHTLLSLTGGFNDQWGTAIAYEAAIDDLTESLDKNGGSMDIQTAKGRANSGALRACFEAAEAQYQANLKAGMSAEQAAAQYNAQIEAARATAIANGAAADEVNRLAWQQRNLPDGKTIVNVVVTRFRTEGGPNYSPGGGTRIAERFGGIVMARNGLMAFGGTSGIASGGHPLIGFAEPGTGGEAFIARNAPQGRSLAIANQAAGWHGGQVVPKGWMGGGTVKVALSVGVGAGFGGDPLVGAVISMFRDRKIVLRDESNRPVRLAGG